MSIGTTHQFKPLTKSSEALDGQRLVRLIAKGKNKSPNLSESLCVSVPVVGSEQVADYIGDLLPFVVGMVQDAQDKMIREYRVESGKDEINEELFDLPHVIAWLGENATSERLTSEMIREWFMTDYGDAVIGWIKSRPGMSDLGVDALNHKLNAVCGVMETFASGSKHRHTRPILNMVIGLCGEMECDARLAHIGNTAARKLAEMDSAGDALDGLI